MPPFVDSLFPFGRSDTSDASLSPEVRRTGLRLYRQAWDAYRTAGCPFGETDEGMLVWYTFQQDEAEIAGTVGRN